MSNSISKVDDNLFLPVKASAEVDKMIVTVASRHGVSPDVLRAKVAQFTADDIVADVVFMTGVVKGIMDSITFLKARGYNIGDLEKLITNPWLE